MAGPRKDPLRPFQPHEQQVLERMAHSQAESAVHVERAKALLAVAGGASYPKAARAAGRKSAIAVSNLVSQFNQRGLQALELRHGGGNPVTYDAQMQKKIIDVFRTPPDREQDGTSVWSLTTLQQRLRREGMKHVCTATIRIALHEAGLSWQRNRTWMDTGKTVRMRKSGPVEVEDIDGEAKKKSHPGGLHDRSKAGLRDLQRRRSRALSSHPAAGPQLAARRKA